MNDFHNTEAFKELLGAIEKQYGPIESYSVCHNFEDDLERLANTKEEGEEDNEKSIDMKYLPGQQEQYSFDLGNEKCVEWMKLACTHNPMISLSCPEYFHADHRRFINLSPKEALLLLQWLQEQQETLSYLAQQ